MDPLTTAPPVPPPHQRTHPSPAAVLELVAEMASTPLEEVGTPEHLTWVCAQGRRALGVHGLAVHLVDDAGAGALAASSDPLTADLALASGPALAGLDLLDRSGRRLGRLSVDVTGPLPDATHLVADVLAAGLVAAAAQRRSAELVARLTTALADRAPVEQAKGVLAERYQCDVGAAFAMIRAQARRQRLPVLTAARVVLATVAGAPAGTPAR